MSNSPVARESNFRNWWIRSTQFPLSYINGRRAKEQPHTQSFARMCRCTSLLLSCYSTIWLKCLRGAVLSVEKDLVLRVLCMNIIYKYKNVHAPYNLIILWIITGVSHAYFTRAALTVSPCRSFLYSLLHSVYPFNFTSYLPLSISTITFTWI